MLAINSLAPALINGKLRAFMEERVPGEGDGPPPLKFIVNVSAMEGRFYKVRAVPTWACPHASHGAIPTDAPLPALRLASRTRC